eukprot:COSAG06_NODE_16980_length_969_cov_1.156322_1_plen_104_part_10
MAAAAHTHCNVKTVEIAATPETFYDASLWFIGPNIQNMPEFLRTKMGLFSPMNLKRIVPAPKFIKVHESAAILVHFRHSRVEFRVAESCAHVLRQPGDLLPVQL